MAECDICGRPCVDRLCPACLRLVGPGTEFEPEPVNYRPDERPDDDDDRPPR